MRRREVLMSLLGGMLLACARDASDEAGGPENTTVQPKSAPPSKEPAVDLKCVDLLLDTEGRTLGKAYLEARSAEADPGRLATLLSVDGRCDLETIQASIAADYGADRLVELKGWLISRTEGRLLALASFKRAPTR